MSRSYCRIVPRDLFNESKLLKCLGQLTLLIINGKVPPSLKVVASGKPFKIDQDVTDGGLFVSSETLRFHVCGVNLFLKSSLNSRLNYPLLLDVPETRELIDVLTEEGSTTDEFCNYVLRVEAERYMQAKLSKTSDNLFSLQELEEEE